MALDANIILQGRAPQFMNQMDVAKDAMTMKQLAMQNQSLEKESNDRSTINDILKRNTTLDSSGKTTINRGAALSDLYKFNPQKAMDFQKQLSAQDMDQLKIHTEAAKALAWSATPENYTQIKAKAIEMGLPNSDKLPDTYSPEFVQRWQIATLNGEEQLKKSQNDAELGLKQQEFGLKQTGQKLDYGDKAEGRKIDWAKVGIDRKKAEAEADANKKSGTFEGQKALDRDYAKDYNDWTSTSRNALDKNLQRLENAKAALQSDPSLTGSIRGTLPDFIRNTTNEKAISVRDEVRAAAQGALKATLGTAFTEKEGERIMNQAYNEKLSPEENIRKIDQAIAELLANKSNNDKKAIYFQKNGTLNGLDILSNQQNSSNQQAPKTVRMTDKSGRFFDVPAELYGEAIAAGASKVKQ